jgi:lipopolysaccharide biosynthesis regulator YciM
MITYNISFRQHIESAIQIFERTWDAVPRIARSTFLLGEVLTQLGDHERAVEASKEATKLRGSITTFPITKDETMKAYDVLVNSWFR